MFYQVFDLGACLKHTYYGAKGSADTLTDEETGKPVVKWQTAANSFLSRYIEPLSSMRNLLVAMDMGCDYRKAFFPEYKATREKVERPKLEVEQYGLFKEWAKHFLTYAGATLIGVKGVEADDVVAWLCSAEGFSGVVHTVDADLLQLVGPRCSVSLKGEVYSDGMDYHGYPTRHTSLIKSMLGDSSDGYGGVPGFGPKGLEALVADIGLDGLDELQVVIEHADRATLEAAVEGSPDSKPLKKLLDNWSTWVDMYRIARLHPELCWKPRAGKLTKPVICKRVPNAEKILALFTEAGAEDLWPTYEKRFPVMYPLEREDFAARLGTMKAEMKASAFVAFDYETTDVLQIDRFKQASSNKDFVDVLSQDITGVSFCFGEHLERVVYIPVNHRECDNVEPDELKKLFVWLKAEHIQLVAQNAPFEGIVTRTCMDLALPNVWDTRIMQRYIDENASAHLKDMSLAYLAYLQQTYQEVTQGRKMDDLTLGEVLKYGCDDSLVTAHLCDLFQLLLACEQQWQHYLDFCVAPREVLEAAHVEGANINWALQKRLADADRGAVQSGMVKLRKILSNHISGDITAGCKSLIETEREYVKASLKAKYKALPDETDEVKKDRVEMIEQKYVEWEDKLKAACVYVPYTRETVMPKFSFTPKVASEAAKALGLPPIEKLTKQALRDYFDATGWSRSDPPEYGPHHTQFLEILATFAAKGKDGKVWIEENYPDFFQRVLKTEPKVVESGDELNVGSSEQMKQLLYCKIGVPVRMFGKQVSKGRLELGVRQGAPATDEQAVKAALANDVEAGSWQEEALNTLLSIKKADTRTKLFHNTMPLWVHVDGKVHPHITDSGTDTRRPTGSSPNILQMPGHGEGAFMRSMYMPPSPDHVCVAIDFSGQELRILANESGDLAMLEAYTPGREKDIHSMTAVGIARQKAMSDHSLKPLCEFEYLNKARKNHEDPLFLFADKFRKLAKGVNFGLAYGAAAPTLSRNLLVPVEEAEGMLEGTLELYKRIRPWQEETGEFMKKNGYTLTAFGTRRHALDTLFSSDKGEVSRMLRQGINATIQSCAAECLKYILTKIATSGMLHRIRMQFFAPIYDEVVAWVHKDDVLAYWHEISQIMRDSTPPGHTVPQVPELSIGGDWGNCIELGADPTDEKILETVAKCIDDEKKVWDTDMKLTWEDVYGEAMKEAA